MLYYVGMSLPILQVYFCLQVCFPKFVYMDAELLNECLSTCVISPSILLVSTCCYYRWAEQLFDCSHFRTNILSYLNYSAVIDITYWDIYGTIVKYRIVTSVAIPSTCVKIELEIMKGVNLRSNFVRGGESIIL